MNVISVPLESRIGRAIIDHPAGEYQVGIALTAGHKLITIPGGSASHTLVYEQNGKYYVELYFNEASL